MALEIHLCNLSGSTSVITAERQWTLMQLKLAIQAKLGVMPLEQRLVCGAAVLHDEDELLGALADSVGSARQVVLVRRTSQQTTWIERVRRLGIMLYDVPSELKGDRELSLEAVKQNEEAFQYVDATLQADRGFVLEAVRMNALVLPYIPPVFRSDREVILAAVSRRGETLASVSHEFCSDREVVLSAVRQHGLALRYASAGLRADPDVAAAALEQNAGAVAYVAEQLRIENEELLAGLRNPVGTLCSEALEHQLVDEVVMLDNWLVL